MQSENSIKQSKLDMELENLRQKLEESHQRLAEELEKSVKIAAIPLVVTFLIIPLARRFLNWDISYGIWNGHGAACIGVSDETDREGFGIVVWKDYLRTNESQYFISFDVAEGFRYPEWTEDFISVSGDELFSTLEKLHTDLKVPARKYLASITPVLSTSGNVAYHFGLEDLKLMVQNGC